jgi:uncharacterized protein (DUF433 family)
MDVLKLSATITTMILEPIKSPLREERGVLRVGRTRVSFESLWAAYQHGESPEAIQENFPSCSLKEIYAVIAQALAKPVEIKAYLERRMLEDQASLALVAQEPKSIALRAKIMARAALLPK